MDRRRLQVDYVFDIETENWDTFVCGGILQVANGEVWLFTDEDEMADVLLSLSGRCWGHNAGRYDTLWFAMHARRRKLAARVWSTSARVTLMQIGELYVSDSAALAPMKLEDFALLGGSYKSNVELSCRCGRDCGGYCRIRRGMPRVELAKVLRYLEQDLVALAAALDGLQDFADENDLDLCNTVGASSWRTALRRSSAIPEETTLPPNLYKLARNGYYGGRVQVFRPRAERGYRYDVNSAYPAALTVTPLPVGPAFEVAGVRAQAAFENGYPGIFTTAVSVPLGDWIPPLPYRTPERVCYPVGDFVGTWTALELRHALSQGTTVRQWGRAVYWREQALILEPFAAYVWSLRDRAGKKSPHGKWCKWFANSLTGKLAQSPETETCLVGEVCPSPQFRPMGKPGSGVWVRDVWRIPPNGFVQWAAYLTAHARVELHKMLVYGRFKCEDAIYCDTDSCFSMGPRWRWDIGDGLGQWAEEGTLDGWEALAPKTYRYRDGAGDEHIAAKGITDPDWQSLQNHEPQRLDRGVYQWRTAIKEEQLFRRKSLQRKLGFDGVHFGDRTLREDGLTYPPIFGGG